MGKEEDIIFEGLNSAQHEAVSQTEGASLIIAGAGSGKTKVLTCRIANAIDRGCTPSRILALTFTKKAASEMKGRISALVGEKNARWIWMGTFHSIFIRFLRNYSQLIGYPEQFTIYDQSDSKSAIRQCIKELNLDEKIYRPNEIQSRISFAKNNLITCAAYRNNSEIVAQDHASRKGMICDIYDLYTKKCKTAGAMDFDDILLNTNILLRDFKDALNELQDRFNYIFVDEYQDTNYAQYLILKKMAAKHRNICVVGDDSQSIYGFRGARVENILNFQKDYPEAVIFRLEQNYRSTQTIVNAANSLICKNENRLKKECFSKADKGEMIDVINAYTEQEEGYQIANSISDRIYKDKASYDCFAILYRTNAQSRAIEEALRKKNLPYKIYAGFSFYDRAEVKDMLAYFRLAINPKDDEAFRRAINSPARGIGDTSLSRLSRIARENGLSLHDAIFLDEAKLSEGGLKAAAINRILAFAKMTEEFNQKINDTDAYTLAMQIGSASGLPASFKNENTTEAEAKISNIEELFNSIKDFCENEEEMRRLDAETGSAENNNTEEMDILVTLPEYVENLTLLSEVEKEDENDKDANNKITLMTIHASKGLEFPYVYITGMEENLFPSSSMNILPKDIEEERRLFYVAMTRAKKKITLSFAKNRMKWGNHESHQVSRFVKEIDRQYLNGNIDESVPDIITNEGLSGHTFYRSTGPKYINNNSISVHKPSPDFKADPVADLKEGQKVEHDRFGYGVIISIDGEGANKKAIINFENSEKKTLLLKFAKLRICKE